LETRRLKGVLALTLVLASLIVLPTTVFKTANAQGWLTGWKYRRAVTVDNTANPNTLTNYQVLVAIDTASLISAGKMRSDCGDIRFTDSDGVTLLSYWIESGCNTNSTMIWVRVPSIPGGSIKTIYMYYGNPSATSTSSGADTFDDFDDFLTNTLANYVQIDSGWSIDTTPPGYLKSPSTGGFIAKPKSLPRSYAVRARVYMSTSYLGVGFIWGNAGAGEASVSGYIAHYYPSSTYSKLRRYVSGSTPTDLASLPALTSGWYIIEVRVTSTNVIAIRQHWTADANGTDTYFSTLNGVGFRQYVGNTYAVDWWALRKYSEPEPTAIIPNAEEATDTTAPPSWLSGWLYNKAVFINNTLNANNLADYQVLVVVDTASLIAQGKMEPDCRDLRFTDDDGVTLLNYWIEPGTCNTASTMIWVRVPSIPGGSIKTIYMYYGNPQASRASNGSATFWFFDDFTSDRSANGTWSNLVLESFGGKYVMSVVAGNAEIVLTLKSNASSLGVEFRYYIVSVGAYGPRADIKFYEAGTSKFYSIRTEYGHKIGYYDGSTYNYLVTILVEYKRGVWYRNYFYRDSGVGRLVGLLGQSPVMTTTHTALTLFNRVGFATWDTGNKYYIDWVAVRNYAYPEPTASVSIVENANPTKVDLPSTSVIFRHTLVYSPNSTLFTHNFTATNTSTAGYETSYGGDAWAWRVYANPYTDPTTGLLTLENTASLVSNITITLPYATMLIEKLELYAKTNGTGSYRQLWVKVLNSAGSVVAEVSNATMGTTWALNTVVVNSLLSDNVTIWINATVTSTTSVGEEICVTGVKLYMSYNTTTHTVAILARSDRHNVTTTFTVNLNTTLTNSSTVDLLVVDKLTYNSTDYPATPSYVGNETVNSNNYLVYRITDVTSTGTYHVYSTIQNAITNIAFKSRGVEVTRVLVGEPVTIEIPVTGNISVPKLNLEYLNTSSATVAFNAPGSYVVVANATRSAEYILGHWLTTIVVDYGTFTANFSDMDGKPVDYETLDLIVVNKNTGDVKSARAKVSASFTGLKYGVHELTARLKGVPVCYGTLDLYFATDASVLNLTCTLKRVLDYRGLNRSLIFELGKQLVSFEDLSKYPYSRSRVLLNGTGTFTLILDYYGKKPTSVDIAVNVTITRWYWDGYYLVITGTLGSVGEVNITDLYKLRVEVYDRLGNLIPFSVPLYINGTAYYTPVTEGLFYPETYKVVLPSEIYGFKFYGFSDGYTDTVRLVDVSTSDVVLKAYYRVPSKVEVKAYQVASLVEAIKRLFNLAENEYVSVFFEGKLLDYYGGGVPGRAITVRLYRAGSLVAEYNVTTDPTGYWRTPAMQLLRGETYTVSVYYAGDDTYVESGAVYEFTSEAPPTPPAVTAPPLEILVLATGALLLVGLALAITHTVRHVVVETREKEARFVKKKQS